MLAYSRWNLPCSRLHAAISIGLSPDGTLREDGLSWMESSEKLVLPRMESTVHAAVSIGLPPKGSIEKMGYPGWNLWKSWGYFGWNPQRSHLQAAVSIRLPWMEPVDKLGLPHMESTLQPSTCCFCHWATPDAVLEKMGHPGWNQD
jgi:hypothetical protein